ncbi:hypothetical protein [Thiolapillus sp.]|uniref:hypothetical protein n=1 Tax=Thiolapillus sp. TaxID=2017437 RepID=UPI003AF4C256
MPQPSWSPSTTQQLRKLVAAPYLSPNDWTPRLDAYFASPLALCARRVSSAASRLLGSTSLRFALHGWQRMRTMAFVGELIPVLPFPDSLWCNIVLLGKIHLLTIMLSLDLSTQLWCCTGLWMDNHGVMLPPGFA